MRKFWAAGGTLSIPLRGNVPEERAAIGVPFTPGSGGCAGIAGLPETLATGAEGERDAARAGKYWKKPASSAGGEHPRRATCAGPAPPGSRPRLSHSRIPPRATMTENIPSRS